MIRDAQCNVEFGKYIEKNYGNWIRDRGKSPVLSVDLVKKYVNPGIKKGQKDCPASY